MHTHNGILLCTHIMEYYYTHNGILLHTYNGILLYTHTQWDITTHTHTMEYYSVIRKKGVTAICSNAGGPRKYT